MKENTYIDYISSEVIMDQFRNELRTYFDSKVLDNTLFWTIFEECLKPFGTKYHPEDKAVLEVNNGMADLPGDFKRLVLALGCSGGSAEMIDNRSLATEEVDIQDITPCELELCTTSVCVDECNSMYKIIQKTPTMRITWDKFEVLKIEDDPNVCLEGCLNYQSNSSDYIKISGNKIYTNFEGLIYLEYLKELHQGDEILYPNHEIIVKWINSKLREKAFQYLYYNSIGDVKVRYMDAKREAYIDEENAKSLIKRNELYNFYNLANVLVRRYNRTARSIWNERNYPGHYGI